MSLLQWRGTVAKVLNPFYFHMLRVLRVMHFMSFLSTKVMLWSETKIGLSNWMVSDDKFKSNINCIHTLQIL